MNKILLSALLSAVYVASSIAMVGEKPLIVNATIIPAPNGIITVTASGGMPPYTYSISGRNPQQLNTFYGLAAGSYEVRATDSFGKTARVSALVSVN